MKTQTLRGVVLRKVERSSIDSTEELLRDRLLTDGDYTHGIVKHGAQEFAYYEYQSGVTHHTNSVEAFWKVFKKSVASTDIHVSRKYMDRYLSEFAFRSNRGGMGNVIFDLFIDAI